MRQANRADFMSTGHGVCDGVVVATRNLVDVNQWDEGDDLVLGVRTQALEGAAPHELLQWIAEQRRSDFHLVRDFTATFLKAFDVPLRTLRDAEEWGEFPGYGTSSDIAAFDECLGPFVDSWRARQGDVVEGVPSSR